MYGHPLAIRWLSAGEFYVDDPRVAVRATARVRGRASRIDLGIERLEREAARELDDRTRGRALGAGSGGIIGDSIVDGVDTARDGVDRRRREADHLSALFHRKKRRAGTQSQRRLGEPLRSSLKELTPHEQREPRTPRAEDHDCGEKTGLAAARELGRHRRYPLWASRARR